MTSVAVAPTSADVTTTSLPCGGYRFPLISLAGLTSVDKLKALRLNSLSSLYYFTKFILGRRRMTDGLHQPLCNFLERDHVKDVIEWPRDHFKSTIAVEGRPVWRALPFTARDEDEFSKRGAPKEFILFMQRQHQPTRRSLLVSENLTNAAKLGKRIRYHFESNSIYRGAFPESLPTSACKWTDYSLQVNRTGFSGRSGSAHGEGSFDFLGVGGALQSRHYDDITQDDLVGRKAAESASVMEDTINYHRLVIGAFDQPDAEHEGDELVIGNRWGFTDLNSHIREHEPWFSITSHSALGGCCGLHQPNTPIFPEEFSETKLLRWKKRLGSYLFSCQFLNDPIAPEDADFQAAWLNYFRVKKGIEGRLTIVHEVTDGIVRKDIPLRQMNIAMAVDPNHSGNAAAGRCRHAIVVFASNGEDFYLLEAWAHHCSYGALVDKIYEVADRWRLLKFGLETVAAQKYLAFHIEQKNKATGRRLQIISLKGEVELADGTMSRNKAWRIRNTLSPIAEFGHLFVQRDQIAFFGEYSTFPKGKFCDLLDASAYVPQMLRRVISRERASILMQQNFERAQLVGQAYSVQ